MNPGTLVIVNLLGGVALLLWGVRMVRTGVLRAWGDRLKRFIEQRLSNRVSAFIAGGAGTAILGSGTAMALIVAGLAASGSISTPLGLAVLLGADAGSAMVSSLFASGSGFALFASPILLFVGYIVFQTSAEFRPHNVGRILIGIGLLLLALKLIAAATAPLSAASLFHDVLAAIGAEKMLAFITGAALAWLFHSTLAVILLVASLLANGSLELAGALSLILGINFGGGLPALTGTLSLPAAARRLPLANLICRGLAALLLLALSDHLLPAFNRFAAMPVESAMAFHTLFNLAVGILFLPFIGPVSALVHRIAPDQKEADDHLAAPRYLDSKALITPQVALANAVNETVRMSELLDRMFQTALTAFKSGSLERLKLLDSIDQRLNGYQAAVQAYLSELNTAELGPLERRRTLEIMLYVSNLEHAGDIIHLNLTDRIEAKAKESIVFTSEQRAALDGLCEIISQSLKLATGVLSSGDLEGAKRLIAQKDAFRALENQVIADHFRDSGKGRGPSLRQSALYVDIIRDLHRINSHIVTAGYPIVEAAGLLRTSRIRRAAKA